jgi:hypothetical protein
VTEARQAIRVALFSMAVFAFGCSGKHIAELTESSGSVERDHAGKLGEWSAAGSGEKFSMGDAVRTGKQSGATLKLKSKAHLQVEAETVMRFLESAPDEENLGVEIGNVSLMAAEGNVTLRSSVGLAVIERGSTVRIGVAGNIMQYEVMVGNAMFKVGNEDTRIAAGQKIAIDIATATILKAAPVPVAVAPKEPEPTAPVTGLVLDLSGKTSSYRQPGESEWADTPKGKIRVADGTELRIPRAGSATVTRGNEVVALQGAGEFVVGGSKSLVEARSGQVAVERATGDVVIQVPGGSITIRSDENTQGASSLTVGKNGVSDLSVRAGVADVTSDDGNERIRAGEQLVLASDGTIEIHGRGPSIADLSINAGESIVVHDPSPPTAVEIRVEKVCPKGGRVEFGQHRMSAAGGGEERAIAVLQRGRHAYDISCKSDIGFDRRASASGVIQILRDEGIATLPRSAPTNFVDTDGRKYTIMYQNLLPAVRLTWPDAPKARGYRVKVEYNGKAKTFTAALNKMEIKTGSLAEGDHIVTYETADGTSRSNATTIKIRFDNAAPTAVVKSPKNQGFTAGASVAVSGVALPGWLVTAEGTTLTLDDNQRFSGNIAVGAKHPALAIRFEHEERGVHFYVRRARRAR